MQSPHILLASSNPRKLIANLQNCLDEAELEKLEESLKANAVGLYRLGEEHYKFARGLGPSCWRQIISRSYYGAFNAARSVRLYVDGHYSAEVSGHKSAINLPEDFPDTATFANRIKNLREDRNLCDYDHTIKESDLVTSRTDALDLTGGFLEHAKTFLKKKGVKL